jgi:hypothetical protein
MSVNELQRDNLIIVVFAGTGVLLLLALLVLHRAYKTALQRLFLYLVTVIM